MSVSVRADVCEPHPGAPLFTQSSVTKARAVQVVSVCVSERKRDCSVYTVHTTALRVAAHIGRVVSHHHFSSVCFGSR